jgi:hypothetical protein
VPHPSTYHTALTLAETDCPVLPDTGSGPVYSDRIACPGYDLITGGRPEAVYRTVSVSPPADSLTHGA